MWPFAKLRIQPLRSGRVAAPRMSRRAVHCRRRIRPMCHLPKTPGTSAQSHHCATVVSLDLNLRVASVIGSLARASIAPAMDRTKSNFRGMQPGEGEDRPLQHRGQSCAIRPGRRSIRVSCCTPEAGNQTVGKVRHRESGAMPTAHWLKSRAGRSYQNQAPAFADAAAGSGAQSLRRKDFRAPEFSKLGDRF